MPNPAAPRDRPALLQRLPRQAVGAEVGVWRGDFSALLLQFAAPEELHLIDPWRFRPELPNRWYGGKLAKDQRGEDRVHLAGGQRCRGASSVRVHRLTSIDAAQTFADDYFDWIYIDGDHSYDAVLADLKAWA